MSNNQQTGKKGEELAAKFVEGLGYSILERRFRFERAEVDLICFDERDSVANGEIVFIEVKARTSRAFGFPEDAVTPAKQRNIIKAATAYLYESKLEGAACRFDVISVDLTKREPEILHLMHAFEATD